MQIRNTKDAYGWISILIHWLMALSIIGMFALGMYMVDLTYLDSWYKQAPHLHISMGAVLFVLLLMRLIWRMSNPVPNIYGNHMEKTIGLMVHRLHYVFMFFLMLSGYLIVTADGRGIEVFSWFEVPAVFPAEKGREAWVGDIHRYLAWAFMGFISLHASAALKHHFIDKDRTLLRMLGIKPE